MSPSPTPPTTVPARTTAAASPAPATSAAPPETGPTDSETEAAKWHERDGDGYESAATTSLPHRTDRMGGPRPAHVADLQATLHAGFHAGSKSDRAHAKRAVQAQLDDERTLNGMANVLNALGGNVRGVRLLAGEGNVHLRIAADGELSSSAAWDPTTREIVVSRDLMDDARGAVDHLRKRHLLDDDGNAVAGRIGDLDTDEDADRLVKLADLVAVHELAHADQDAQQRLAPDGSSLATRARDEEYEAYHAQELQDIALGSRLNILLTVRRDGSQLPREDAVANIVAFETGRPLPNGDDRGWIRPVSSSGAGQAQQDDDATKSTVSESPGFKRPGDDHGGFKRPGDAHIGFKRPADGRS